MHTYNKFTKATQIKRQPCGRKVCDFWRHAKPIAGNSNTSLYKNELELKQANDS